MRDVVQAYRSSWAELWRGKKIWGVLFLTNFLIALFLALPFQSYISKIAGHSSALSYDLGRFDFTFIGDLMNQYGEGIWILFNQSKYIILLFLTVWVFLNGGLISSFIKSVDRRDLSFFHNCGHFFWRLLCMAAMFLLVYGVVFIICWVAFQSLIGGLSPFDWKSDGHLIWSFRIVAIFLSLIWYILMMIHDYAKIQLVGHELGIWAAIKRGASFVFDHFTACFVLYFIHLLTFIALFLSYRYLRCILPIDGMASVLLLFVLGQFFILGRIGIKILNLSSAYFLTQKS